MHFDPSIKSFLIIAYGIVPIGVCPTCLPLPDLVLSMKIFTAVFCSSHHPQAVNGVCIMDTMSSDFCGHSQSREGNIRFGHVTRHESLPRTITHGTLEDGRHRGRHRKCWMDNVKEWTTLPVPELLTMASSLKKKKCLEEDFC